MNIKNLNVAIHSSEVLKNFSLEISQGSIHAIMGKNGSGKSSLAHTIMGHPHYNVTSGSIIFNEQDILSLSADKRAKLGIFLAFQYPVELPGVTVFNFLKESYQALLNVQISVSDFQTLLFDAMKQLELDPLFASRSLNDGFSGGEKKRLEMLQLLLLKPKIALLDEIDSGLDVNGLKLVAQMLNTIKQANPTMSILIITHYQRLLEYVRPDHVHIMHDGSIKKSGDASLALQIEDKGYDLAE